ncbi:hypothetical protein CAOG_08260 [Capsaspora owczarzaki ATCC 30864]|nr:hypothetical protein CAOG_08260 [Capsaspora owczarzaki ATCC 30864]|eukprot:XP_004342429.1 hypothetical protein CAOG_08260 [Capsaspora owczarzaki ATCC 30864]
MSVLGSIAEWVAAFLPVKLIPGAGKQFAQLCGAMISGFAIIAFFAPNYGQSPAGGAVMLGLLMGAAGLEAFFGICLGCIMFDLFIRFGLLSRHINTNAEHFWNEQSRFIEESDRRLNEGKPVVRLLYSTLSPDSERTIPLRIKVKTDEMRQEDFHIVKHMHIHYFAFIMASIGLACVWKVSHAVLKTDKQLWQGLGIFSAVVGGIYVLLYTAKIVFYPRKVWKEWTNPNKVNFFSTITISLLLFAYLSVDVELDMAKSLFWLGASFQLFQAVIITSRWFRFPQSRDAFNPTWMIPAVGNLVAGMVAPLLDPGYTEVAWLWWSFAFLMYIVLITLSFNRIMFGGVVDDKVRPSYFILVAAPAVAFVGYTVLPGAGGAVNGFDAFARFLYYVALVTFFVLGWSFFRSLFGRHNFDQSYWAFVFPLDTMALAALVYHSYISTPVSQAIAVCALIIVNATAVIVLANSVNAAIRLRVWVPEDKWGPLSLNKIVHYATRDACVQLLNLTAIFEAKNETPTAEDIEAYRSLYEKLEHTFNVHSTHEDEIVFPALRLFHPNATLGHEEDHDRERALFEDISLLIGVGEKGREAFASISDADRADRLRQVADLTKMMVASTIKHLDDEEKELGPITRKSFPLKLQKEIVRKMFSRTLPDDLRRYILFVLQYAPFHGQRSRFVQCLRWSFPERLQLFGKWIYEGSDPLVWSRIITEVPELAPRGVQYWHPTV